MQFIQGILFCQNYPLVHQLLLMSQEELPIDFGVGPWFERIQQIDLPIIRPTSRQKESFSISEATFFPSASVMLRRLYLVRCVMPLKENCTKMTWDYQKRNKKFPFTKYLFHSVAGTTIFFIFFLRRLSSLWCHRLLLHTRRGLRARGPSLTCMLPLPKWSLNDYENTTLQLWSKVITKGNFFIF